MAYEILADKSRRLEMDITRRRIESRDDVLAHFFTITNEKVLQRTFGENVGRNKRSAVPASVRVPLILCRNGAMLVPAYKKDDSESRPTVVLKTDELFKLIRPVPCHELLQRTRFCPRAQASEQRRPSRPRDNACETHRCRIESSIRGRQ